MRKVITAIQTLEGINSYLIDIEAQAVDTKDFMIEVFNYPWEERVNEVLREECWDGYCVVADIDLLARTAFYKCIVSQRYLQKVLDMLRERLGVKFWGEGVTETKEDSNEQG